MSRSWFRLGSSACLAAGLAVSFAIDAAHASCNVIPGSKVTFYGAIGSVDSAFGRPDAGDGKTLELAAGMCSGDPKYKDENNDDKVDANDYVVTVAFKPPRGGSSSIVALTAVWSSFHNFMSSRHLARDLAERPGR